MQGLVWAGDRADTCQVLQQANSDSSRGDYSQCTKNALYMQASCPLQCYWHTECSPLLQPEPAPPVSLAAVRAALGCERKQLLA
jgi:hypothetical protein